MYDILPTLLFSLAVSGSAVEPVPPVAETITVTAARTETRVADTPASVVVLGQADLDTSAAPAIDDALRQVAGFTLFRRGGSRVANPTAQGVTLRGIGASGASRALVLDDGVPLNDPFGGWVYWGRVPRGALERVEVLRGGASDLYGSSAMGGVVQFIRRRGESLTAQASAGSHDTFTANAFLARQRGEWTASLAADVLSTSGFVLVRPEERGAVDVNAGSRYSNLDLTLRRGPLFLRGSHFADRRENGTPLQENATVTRQVTLGADTSAAGGAIGFRLYGTDQDYFQTFSAVTAGRAAERLTVEQRVPSRAAGGTLQWVRAAGEKHLLVAGADLRAIRGTSDELRFTPVGTTRVVIPGAQTAAGVFVEDLFTVTQTLMVTASVRFDRWDQEGNGVTTSETQWNPRLALLWRANEAITVSASAYTAFRAPTLNELYRGFRVGNIETLPNAGLASENLTGYEVGLRARNARLTVFSMGVSDAIANVTLDASGSTIIRQRRNIGQTRSRGFELDAGWPLGRSLRATAGWLYVDARMRDAEFRSNRVPQVPKSHATAQLLWSGPIDAGVQARWSSRQFDDDRNTLRLASYFVADTFVSAPLRAGLEVLAAVENVFDAEVEVSATPVITLGQPRAWRIGVRYRDRRWH